MTVDKDTTRVKHIKLYNLLYGLQSHPTIHAASELRTLFFFLSSSSSLLLKNQKLVTNGLSKTIRKQNEREAEKLDAT